MPNYDYVVFDIVPDLEKKLRYRWSKRVGLEPPPKIVPFIELFYFDIEVMTSIYFPISRNHRKMTSKNDDIEVIEK